MALNIGKINFPQLSLKRQKKNFMHINFAQVNVRFLLLYNIDLSWSRSPRYHQIGSASAYYIRSQQITYSIHLVHSLLHNIHLPEALLERHPFITSSDISMIRMRRELRKVGANITPASVKFVKCTYFLFDYERNDSLSESTTRLFWLHSCLFY